MPGTLESTPDAFTHIIVPHPSEAGTSISPILWLKKLIPKKVHNLAKVTGHIRRQFQCQESHPGLPHAGNYDTRSPLSFNKAQEAEAGASCPSLSGLLSAHSRPTVAGSPRSTWMARRHAWGRVKSLSQDDLGLPGPNQTVNIPMLSV